MPKTPTNPTLYDEVLQIDISKLKRWGFLNPEQNVFNSLTWSRNGEETASISFFINNMCDNLYIELSYNYRDEPRKYKITITSIISNLGKGRVPYFLCPVTQKRCRKLYLINGYFLHREAFSGCMYRCQAYSKSKGQLESIFDNFFKVERYYDEMESRYFKIYYRGRPTKRYLRLIKKIKNIDNGEIF